MWVAQCYTVIHPERGIIFVTKKKKNHETTVKEAPINDKCVCQSM